MGWEIPFSNLWVSSPILLFSSFLATAAQWAKICSSQPANKIRSCDSQGCGGYDSPRSWAGMAGDGCAWNFLKIEISMEKWARGGFLAGKALCCGLTHLALLLLQRREEAQGSGRGVWGRLGGVRTLHGEHRQASQALRKRQCHRQRSPAFRIRYQSWTTCVLQSLIAKRSDWFIEL